MIFDVAARSLASSPVLITIEQLLGDCTGSRMPEVDPGRLTLDGASLAVDACPTSALQLQEVGAARHLVLNYGECIGCGSCVEASRGALRAAERLVHCGVAKAELVRRWDIESRSELFADDPAVAGAAAEIRALLGRALNIRQVDAGSCNGCEAEIVALTNPYYDLERFGIHFVASPKHADMLLVTGPVARNMAEALRQTYEATPSPKLVVAVGACGCSGGIFAGSYAVAGVPGTGRSCRGGTGAIDELIPVDGFIPGCPPTPAMLLTGILRVLGGRASTVL
jgi:Ni,Fe-hydrogenase III small subunit/NAD-dependent dihydropyrimidine dehydrogenase PreA subunit